MPRVGTSSLHEEMKVTNCPIVFYNEEFRFNRFWGCLIRRKGILEHGNPTIDIAGVKRENIEVVNNPFRIRRRKQGSDMEKIRHPQMAKAYAKTLTWLCTHCYPLVTLLFHLRMNMFRDAENASMFYYSVYPDRKQQQTLCLPRALFIATTSRRFAAHGALFVGAFLRMVRMHAWVMEDGMPADRFDNQWIYYRPVMILS